MCFEAHNFIRFRRIKHDYDLWEYINKGVLNDADTGLQSSNTTLRIMRSEFYWFTEICNSQCLSHFAASFIVSRAEESTVKGRYWMLYKFTFLAHSYSSCVRLLDLGRCAYIINLKHGILQPCFDFIGWWTEIRASHFCWCGRCEWSFRRFTYGSLVTTCPSSKW